MDEQTEGEKRAWAILIQPLQDLGLGRPKGATVKQGETMLAELAKGLWRLDGEGLRDLKAWVEVHPEALANRWPPMLAILKEARRLHPEDGRPTGLQRAVFAHAIGQGAIAGGWAPELLAAIKETPRFPDSEFRLKMIRDKAEPALDRLRRLTDLEAQGRPLPEVDQAWLERRLRITDWCHKAGAAQAEGV
jgi:hypothetical protein